MRNGAHSLVLIPTTLSGNFSHPTSHVPPLRVTPFGPCWQVEAMEAVPKREVFGEGPRALVLERRRTQKAFVFAEADAGAALPTKAAGLGLHMGDLTLPKPVVFAGAKPPAGGSSGSSGGGGGRAGIRFGARGSMSDGVSDQSVEDAVRCGWASRSGGVPKTTAMTLAGLTVESRPTVGPVRCARSLTALLEALADAKLQVEGFGSRSPVGDGRMVSLLASALCQDPHPAARAMGQSLADHRAALRAANRREAAAAAVQRPPSRHGAPFVSEDGVLSFAEAVALVAAHPRAHELEEAPEEAPKGGGHGSCGDKDAEEEASTEPPEPLAASPRPWRF